MFLFFSLLILSFGSQANNELNVGLITIDFKDDDRMAWDGKNKRPILTHVFYPTLEKRVEPLLLGKPDEALFNAGNIAWNAKPLIHQKQPLIMMSHGTGGSALQMLWLAEKLVKSGYLVVGLNHHGNTAAEPKKYAEGYTLWWERAQDLSVVLDKLLKHQDWSPFIDKNRVGIIGFSLGGYTAISALGGITDKSLFKQFCQSKHRDFTCDPQVEFEQIRKEFDKVKDTASVKASLSRQHDSYKVDAIKAGFVIAPALAQAMTKESLESITVPISVVVGSNDQVAPATTNAFRISSLIENGSYHEINNVGHYTFLSNCTALGKQLLSALCQDHKAVDRFRIHNDVSQQAVDFFNGVFTQHRAQ